MTSDWGLDLAKFSVGKGAAIVSEFAGRRIVREPVPIEKAEPLKLELQSFVECVREHHAPVVSGEAARRALDVAFEITRQINAVSAMTPPPGGAG